jgi:hypothetical protein
VTCLDSILHRLEPVEFQQYQQQNKVHTPEYEHTPAEMQEYALPEPTSEPKRYPDCCISISTKLIDSLKYVIGQSNVRTVLSIGSGTGLLEAILAQALHSPSNPSLLSTALEGVEVQQTENGKPVNRYLPERAINTVRGTWDLSPRIDDDDVGAILFVYPRLPALVSKCVERILQGPSKCHLVIWLGPCADWVEFEPCFRVDSGVGGVAIAVVNTMEGDEAGLVGYEMMAVMKVQRRVA